ncbi:PLP-dependent aminotransferase family protein [Fervidicoccus sp.]|uniref:aminotransferase-like domain-containing protein n=1 Tax=Fervidicoccus sp. TaxID=2060324 RepID=UPI003C83EBF4
MNYNSFLNKEISDFLSLEVPGFPEPPQGRKVIMFSEGRPNFSRFPLDKALPYVQEVFKTEYQTMLQYPPIKGNPELMKELRKLMEKYVSLKGTEDDDMIIMSGSQQALYMVSRILVDPGDYIVVERPTYLEAIFAFTYNKAKMLGVNQDENGMKTDELETLLRKLKSEGKRIKFVYTVPNYQNPSGATLPMERRKHLYELASQYDFLIFEDDAYCYLSYEGKALPAIKSLDTEGRVIFTSTLSKILSPGLRIGWVFANKEIVKALLAAKEVIDLGVSGISQYLATIWLRNGIHEEFLKIAIPWYKQKRDIMLEMLDELFRNDAHWTKPKGGLFIYVQFNNKKVNTQKLLEYAKKKGVLFVSGQPFYHDFSVLNTIRLNFSMPTEDEIKEGIRLLREAYDEYLSSGL